MEIPMNGQRIKDQYTQGPKPTDAPLQNQLQNQQMPTPEEIQKKKEEREKFLDEMLPFMRKEEEYGRLQMSLLEMDVLMGRIPTNQIGGVIGLELRMREIQAHSYLAQYAAGQKGAEDMAKKQQEMAEQEKRSKEQWDALTPDVQAEVMKEAEETATRNGIAEGWKSLSEDQKINVAMMTHAMKTTGAIPIPS